MSVTKILLWGGLVPALIVFGGLFAAWFLVFAGRRVGEGDAPRCPRCDSEREGAEAKKRCSVCQARAPRRVRTHNPHWALALLLAGGFVPAYFALHGQIQLWPLETAQRYVHVGVAAAIVGIVEGLVVLPLVAVLVLRFGACGFASWALLEGLRGNGQVDDASLWTAVGIIGAAGVIATVLLDAGSRRISLIFVGLSLAIGLGATSVFLKELAFSIDAARLSGALIAMSCALGCFSLMSRDVRLDRGGSVVLVSLMLSLLVGGRWLGGWWSPEAWVPGLPWVSLLLLILAPGAIGVVRLGWLSRGRRLVRALAGLIAVVIVSGAGGFSAWLISPSPPPEEENPYADYEEP